VTAPALAPYAAAARRDWTSALAALAAGLAVFGFVFATEITAAVATWERSAAYNHCWLVLPIAVWLAWQRRERLVGLRPVPMPLAAVAASAPAVRGWWPSASASWRGGNWRRWPSCRRWSSPCSAGVFA